MLPFEKGVFAENVLFFFSFLFFLSIFFFFFFGGHIQVFILCECAFFILVKKRKMSLSLACSHPLISATHSLFLLLFFQVIMNLDNNFQIAEQNQTSSQTDIFFLIRKSTMAQK